MKRSTAKSEKDRIHIHLTGAIRLCNTSNRKKRGKKVANGNFEQWHQKSHYANAITCVWIFYIVFFSSVSKRNNIGSAHQTEEQQIWNNDKKRERNVNLVIKMFMMELILCWSVNEYALKINNNNSNNSYKCKKTIRTNRCTTRGIARKIKKKNSNKRQRQLNKNKERQQQNKVNKKQNMHAPEEDKLVCYRHYKPVAYKRVVESVVESRKHINIHTQQP